MDVALAPLAEGLGIELTPLRVANLELWPAEFQVLVDGRRLYLSRTEFSVLHVLALAEGHVVSKERVYALVWGRELPGARNRSVDVYVYKLRGKLAKAAPGRRFIHTHLGVGYRLQAEDDW